MSLNQMSNEQAAEIQKSVFPFRPTESMNCALDSFDAARSKVNTLPWVSGCNPLEIDVTVAMCLLGPQGAGPPPANQRQDIINHLNRLAPTGRRSLLDEVVIAYGCGWQRQVRNVRGADWKDRWANAVICMIVRAVMPAVQKVNAWLAQAELRGYLTRSFQDLWDDAQPLALMFVDPTRAYIGRRQIVGQFTALADDGVRVCLANPHPVELEPVPPSSHLLFTTENPLNLELSDSWQFQAAGGSRIEILARDDDAQINIARPRRPKTIPQNQTATAGASGASRLHVWKCRCAWIHCADQHRLESWDAHKHSLWNYTFNAICGPSRQLRLNSLRSGMYLPFLIQEGMPRLRIVPAEIHICSCDHKYQGVRCPRDRCRRAFNENQMRKNSDEWLIETSLADTNRVIRCRCQNKEGHYRRINNIEDNTPVPEEILNDDTWDNLCDPPPTGVLPLICPLCNQAVDTRPSRVWLINLVNVLHLEDLNNQGDGRPNDDEENQDEEGQR